MATNLEASLVALEYSRHFVQALLDTIPEDQLCHQPFPGANHALWIMGHVASVDAFLGQACGGPQDPQLESWQPTFFMKSEPSPNPGDYPPADEVRAWFQSTRQAVLDWFRSQDEQQLGTPLPEGLREIAPDRLSLIARLAIHEAGHGGQLTMIRKSLGLPPVFA
ncbi:MAG: DinB family protein [Candidatus Anammoximicrobium sp.]|nr:DinB family protein [Candidatus Anammoximicrobium sp.]